ncbi:MAG: 3-deoxy-7-phosphoheptulonate synthase [Bacteroidetes bacterium]|nr:3-deoxy-7-phosphoheptulonate synthase [Bacteroidota bacterium]
MVIHTIRGIDQQNLDALQDALKAVSYPREDYHILVTPSGLKTVPDQWKKFVSEAFVCDSDIQLASTQYRAKKRLIDLGDGLAFGKAGLTLMMAGPCSVESEEQIEQTAQLLLKLGIRILRAGSFKPRTSPYNFQGLGLEGLKLLARMREKYGFRIITEVRDASQVEEVIEYADIIQIGSKSMFDHGILQKCSKTSKPVMLKRGFGATVQEFVQMSEFMLSGGNENIILCERGIRTFETKSRFTLDLCGVAYLKKYTNLPIVLDPSHAMGHAYGVPDLAKACLAMGVDGLLIEVHPNPEVALSDASQQLDHAAFTSLYRELSAMSNALNIKLI